MLNFWFWLLFPWVLPQALWLRRRLPRFTPPDGRCIGQFGETPRVTVVGIGDSIIAGAGARHTHHTLTAQWAQAWHQINDLGVTWRAHGKIGAKASKILRMLENHSTDRDTDFVLLSVGVNDLLALDPLKVWRRNLSDLLVRLHDLYPNAQIMMLGIPPLARFPALPSPLRQVMGLRGKLFDQIAAQCISRQSRCHYFRIERVPEKHDFASDGFHPSQESYRALAEWMIGSFLKN